MENGKILAIFSDTVTDNALAEIEKNHTNLVHDFSNEQEFKAARKVNTEMNKLLKDVDRVGIDAAKQVTDLRNELKEKVEQAYSGTVTPFKIEDQKRKDEAARIKAEREKRIKEQQEKLALIKGASARAIHLPIDDIENILQDVMSIEIDFFDADMQQEAQTAKDISLDQLNDAFKFAHQKEEMRKKEELQQSELADKDDEIARLKALLGEKQPEVQLASITLGEELGRWANSNDLPNHVYADLLDLIEKYIPLTTTEQ
jgi:sRNA-binding carbon storage regulator CsrA